MMWVARSVAILVLVSTSFTIARDDALRPFIGEWDGIYKSQPVKLAPDGGYPEVTHRFRLTVSGGNGAVKGQFEDLARHDHKRTSISHIGSFTGGRMCFDVVLDGRDDRWCVYINGEDLIGVWSSGPQGGKDLDGMGAGSRLFAVKAHRIRSKSK